MFHILTILCFIAIKNASSSSYPVLSQITPPTLHSEGPIWDYRTQILYFVDIPRGILFAYHSKTHQVNSISFPGQLSIVFPTKTSPDHLLLALNRSLISITWNSATTLSSTASKILLTVQPAFPASRFNDGKADVRGRLWMGTMGPENHGQVPPNEGKLYKIAADLHPEVMLAPVNISNGLAWNAANDRFFYIDTPTRRVLQYDFDAYNGTLSQQRVCFDLAWHHQLAGNPDGMTIDAEDNLWVALYGGGAVVKVDSRSGRLLQLVAMPAKFVTSVMWGGPKLDVLFVTTSRKDLAEGEMASQPAAGSVFAIRNLGTKGVRIHLAKLLGYEY